MHTVFPTGTTVYNPEKCFTGYTLYPSKTTGVGAVLVDMNGEVVRTWPIFMSFMINLLPGGTLLGGQIGRVTKVYDQTYECCLVSIERHKKSDFLSHKCPLHDPENL